ncbi:glycosyltransferase family 2 protein [Niallia sp. JL1B1071]|uniref:glycosyltransferase family 2 protein n=1 Tax=Niallia tiangongensis TaxID=3237105 RepID=UPI0037DC84CD
MNTPKVSVIMPSYNCALYITEAIDSVLSQTFKNFELIIVDDGSTDNTIELIENYNDKRIILIKNEMNRGVATTRNIGYKASKGEYIVISDSDDINLPMKFEEQVNYLDNHEDIDIVGCHYQHFSELKYLQKWAFSDENEYIKSMRLFWNEQAPASMFRKKKIESLGLLYHDESYQAAVDSEWFSKMPKEIRFTNIQKVLYLYRRHTNQMTQEGVQNTQSKFVDKIRENMIVNTGIVPSQFEKIIHFTLCDYTSVERYPDLPFIEIRNWAEKLIIANEESKFNEINIFSKLVARRFFELCNHFSYQGNKVWNAWEEFKYKHLLDEEVKLIPDEVILKLLKNKSVAIFGTLRSAYILLYRLQRLNLNISYLIDNNLESSITEIDGYSVYRIDELNRKPVDIVIMTVQSNNRYLLKSYIQTNHKKIKTLLIEDFI